MTPILLFPLDISMCAHQSIKARVAGPLVLSAIWLKSDDTLQEDSFFCTASLRLRRVGLL
jgi:hypothetical protein